MPFLFHNHSQLGIGRLSVLELGSDLDWDAEGNSRCQDIHSGSMVGQREVQRVGAGYQAGVEGWYEGLRARDGDRDYDRGGIIVVLKE